MSNNRVLHADGRWSDDPWHIVREEAAASEGWIVVPLASYLALSKPLGTGVWLAPQDDPAALVPRLDSIPLIAIDFPALGDGRGYSIATLLRRRYGYAGDLRAIGCVLVDQLFFMRRAGFSSFAVRSDQDADRAVSALVTYSDAYQGAAADPTPAFRRHLRPLSTTPGARTLDR